MTSWLLRWTNCSDATGEALPTLSILLGRDRGSAAATFDTDRFPSYGEFTARRSQSDAVNYDSAGGYGYDYDLARRAPSAPRSAEAAREYEASRPYRAPREEEYRAADHLARDYSAPVREDRAYAPERDRAYDGRESGLYEFTRNDAERASGEELYERLSSSGTAQNSARYEQAARASYMTEDYAAKYRAENGAKKRKRLGLKAKLIIAAYVVVLAIVGVLIIVNAVPLNEGTAAVPSGAIVAEL